MCRVIIHVEDIFESNRYNIYNTCISCIGHGFTAYRFKKLKHQREAAQQMDRSLFQGGITLIFYAIIGFFLGDIFAGLPSVTNDVSYWASNLPYLIYPLWLVPVLLFKRSLFEVKESRLSS
jgi:hypothetical protein